MRPRAIFFDWDGVLCHQKFWHQLHPNDPILAATVTLFADAELLEAWMTGALGDRDVLQRLLTGPELDRALDDLVVSCALMACDPAMAKVAARAAAEVDLVAVTSDNMPCFAQAWPVQAPAGITKLLCSSDLACLKREPQRFFGPELDRAGISWEEAVLIDDSPINCLSFQNRGGQAILCSNSEQAAAKIEALLS